jgi:four helix bundle protein
MGKEYEVEEWGDGEFRVCDGIDRFEDLDCWKVARELANGVYHFTKEGSASRDYGFRDQIRRSAISVMNNIAEGFERGSNKDFAHFLFIARGSAGEVRSMLYVALDQGYVSESQFSELKSLCVRSSQICWGMIRHLRDNSDWKTGAYITGIIVLLSLVAFLR